MMRNVGRATWVGAVMVVGAACSEPPESEAPSQPEPWEVELFAPGIVSTDLPEFAISFTASGDTLFFNRTPPDRSRLDLFMSIRGDEGWREATPYEPLAGIAAIDPFVSLDGSRLYFSSGMAGAGTAEGSFNLWSIPLSPETAVPLPLPAPINSDSSDVFNSFSRDGRMVFSSTRDGVRAIYEMTDESTVTRPNVEPEGAASASNPAMNPAGDLLVFASAPEDGSPDLFLSCREDGAWGAPQRLPEPINSPFTDFAPGFGPGYLYFTSERPGIVGPVPEGTRPPGDIYRTPFERVAALCSRMSPGG